MSGATAGEDTGLGQRDTVGEDTDHGQKAY
jgi:hypothetical protein